MVSGDVGSPASVGAGVTNSGFARYNGPADAAGMASAQSAVTAAYLAAEAQSMTSMARLKRSTWLRMASSKGVLMLPFSL